MKKRIRIKDIASRAGVSKGTVDRVIHKRGNVSLQANQKVIRAMEELDYQPNLLASALAYNRNIVIAALLPNPQNDPFWQQPRDGIDRALKAVRDYGITVEHFTFEDADNEGFKEQASKVLKGNFQAVLLAPIFLKEASAFLDQCKIRGLKYVLINTYIDRKDDNFLCYIGQDSYHSGVLAAKLLNFGLSPGETVAICHLEKAVYNSQHLLEKENGFTEYFRNHPTRMIKVITMKFEEVLQENSFEEYLRVQLHHYPKLKGIFVTTSKAHYLLKSLNKLDKTNIKIVGFDLIPPNLNYLHQEEIHFLINQNPLKQGYLAIISLFNYLFLKKKIRSIQHLPLDIVLPENVSYYMEEEEKLHLIV